MSKLNFGPITLDMRELVEGYTRPLGIRNSEYTFSSLAMWGAGGKMSIAESDGALYIKLSFPGYREGMLSPLCKDMGNFSRAVERAEEYMREHGIEPEFQEAPEQLEGAFRALGYETRLDRDNSDYVYDAEDLRTLAGKKFHAKRNHINRFNMDYDYRYIRLEPGMTDECMALYREWSAEHGDEQEDTFGEEQAIYTGLTNLEKLGLVGGGITIDGSLKAFTFGRRIDDEMAVVHIEKADTEIIGLFTAINQQFVTNEFPDMKLINREEDMGIEGLRKAKMSYQPVSFVNKYGVRRQKS